MFEKSPPHASLGILRCKTARGVALVCKQRGFTLIELSIVLTIVAILALFAVPKARSLILSTKVQPTADELASAVARIRTNNTTNGTASYGGVTAALLSTTMMYRTNAFTANGTTLYHKIGSSTTAVTTATTSIAASSDAFTVTLDAVNIAACPELATALQTVAEIIAMGPTGGSLTTVKASASATFNGQVAAGLCTDGDTNKFVFTFR